MVKIIQNKNGLFYLYNQDRKTHDNLLFDKIKKIPGHFLAFNSNKITLYNKTGLKVIDELFDSYSISEHSKSIILEKLEHSNVKYLIISKSGLKTRFIVNDWYESSYKFEDGSFNFILRSGKYKNGITFIWNTKKGYLPFLGQRTIEIFPGIIKNFSLNGFRLFSIDGKLISNERFSDITYLTDNRIVTENEYGCQIRDFSSNLVSDIHFNYIGSFTNGASIAELENQTGLIDINGKWISRYDDLDRDDRWWQYYDSPFKEGFVLIKKDNLYGIVNINEKLHFQPIAQNLIIFHLGHAPIQIENGTWGIIDTNLNWVIKPTLLEMKFCFESYNDVEDYITSIGLPFIAKSSETNKYGLISYDGKWLCEPIYDKIISNDFYNLPHKYLFYLKFERDEYKGIINIKGKLVFTEKIKWRKNKNFDEFDYDFDNYRFDITCNYMNHKVPKKQIYFLVKKNNKNGYFNASGKFRSGNPNQLN
jgi:hypothetical protein